MPRNDRSAEQAGLASWARRWWRALLAEVVATALLVLLGLASLAGPAPPPLTHPAFAFGLVIVALAEIFGPVSGAHMNPAISLAAVIAGRMDVLVALAYFVAQTLGALAGFGLLLALLPPALARPALGCTLPAAGGAAAAAEALLTGALALLACALWAAHDDSRPDRAASLKLGLAVAGLVYAGGEISHASLNPVRSLAPAVFMGQWTHHWAYWVGPLGGAALGALLHRALLAPRPPPAPAREQLPLHDKGQA